MDRKTIVFLTGIFTVLGLASFLVDEPVVDLLSNLRFSVFSEVMKFLTNKLVVGLIAILVPILVLWVKNEKKWILPLVISVLSAVVLTYGFKAVFMRPRPTIALITVGSYSFPSGHAATVFSVIPVIEEKLGKFKWFWIGFACLIAFTRLYLGVHYLSDVIFGGLLGYLVGWILIHEGLERWKAWK
ncbi:hypothetical protein AKJ35_00505 [candidate division MSBL1 archaeon SCGC-AAA833F18]|uniref:Phosphatidic acid phosphatase type 2/haloperoxidase domain-containing protein n=2 Tax=candidate division MSBL1 TaxID=215777 RepID=A0A133VRV8_9EURY|nr:hypothetical protein AKJ46_00850 [candidate division MSBL1 archaeon SCGC-AAA833K04]KXB09624.1 hypothetical protein AKJ35_00505 [candidate division MSBL1 archaeon SCGC-AAA833F18]